MHVHAYLKGATRALQENAFWWHAVFVGALHRPSLAAPTLAATTAAAPYNVVAVPTLAATMSLLNALAAFLIAALLIAVCSPTARY